jgi:hypothetical protein
MNEAEILVEKLMNYYGVFTISELGKHIDSSQPAISQWKKNNYVKAIATKCRELGIYNEIFGETQFNSISNSTFSNGSPAIDNSNNKEQTFNNKQYPDIPEFLLDDINSLFKRAQNKSELISNFDDFIYQQKRILQNGTN